MMMKRISLLVFLCFFSQYLSAQSLNKAHSIDAHKTARVRSFEVYNGEQGQILGSETSSDKTSALTLDKLGNSSNPYTIIRSSTNQVMAVDNADDSKDVVAWIHRQSIDDFTGQPLTTANGVIRIDFIAPQTSGSYCKQGQWALDVGPFNPLPYPNACRPRYPQGVLYTPPGATSFDDSRVIWVGACTDGNSWGNYNWGMAWDLCKFGANARGQNGTNTSIGDLPAVHSFLGSQQDNNVLIPNGMCNGKPGEVWFVDNSFKPEDVLDSILVFKGTVSDKTISWKKQAALRLGKGVQFYNPSRKGLPELGVANMDFSPDGKWGWVVSSAVVQDNPTDPTKQKEFEKKPVFFWSDNYGETWNGPLVVRLRDMPQVKDSIQTRFLEENGDTSISSGVAVPLGSPDITVDKNGNPHVLWNFGNAGDQVMQGKLDSLGYFQAFMSMFDITTDDHGRTWCPKFIHRTVKYQGTVPGTNLAFDNYEQIARDPSGERIFYSWVDDTTRRTQTNAMKPNLHTRAYRVSDGAMTDLTIHSLGDPSWQDKVFFPAMAPTVLTKSDGRFQLPIVFASGIRNENGTTQFSYIKNVFVSETDFKKKSSDVAVDIVEPAEKICFGGNVAVKVKVRNVGTVEVKDSVALTYMINGKTPAREVVKLTAPIAPGGSIDYTFTKLAEINVSGSYALDVMSSVQDDENCSNHFQQRRVLNFGGEARKVFTVGQMTGCGSVTLNTGLVGSIHKWMRDGVEVIPQEQGPMLVVTQTGTAVYTVEVSNADCANEPLKGSITVTVNDVPPITVNTKISECASANGVDLKINDGGADFQYRWLRKRPNATPEQIGTANALNVRQNADLIAWVRNTKTGCTDSAEVEVRLWDVKADLAKDKNKYQTGCGRQTIDAFNETTGEGCEYIWYEKDTTSGQWVEKQPRSKLSSYKSQSIYNLREMCYRVQIYDPRGCNANSPATDSVCFVTTDSEPAAAPALPDTKLESTPLCNLDIGTPNDPVRSTVRFVRTAEENNTQLVSERMIHMKEQFTSGATKVTGKRWVFATQASRIRAFIKDGDMCKRVTDLSINNPELVNQPCIAFYVLNNSAVSNITVEHRVYSSYPDATPRAEGTGNGCQAKYTYVFNAVAGTPNTTEINPDVKCCRVSRQGELATNYDVSVYPNPSTGVYNISAGLPSVSNLDVQVYDINGRLVYNQKWTGSDTYNATIDLKNLTSGIYILKLVGDEGFVSHRLVKE